MGFLDKLLGRKKADEPQTAPEAAPMPADTGTSEHDHSHEGEHDHDHSEEGHQH